MLEQVADGVWVRQSEWVWSNTTVVRTEEGLLLVDPGITQAEMDDLADGLDALGLPVVAGFSTHPHFDHLLWHHRFGDVPRYATAVCARAASAVGDEERDAALQTAEGTDPALFAQVTALPPEGVPGAVVIEHDAHAVGHAALLLADQGVLVAGDMLSDELIPMLDPTRPGQGDAYNEALDRLAEAARHVDVLVPGHGSVARGPEVTARIDVDRAYLDAVRRGADPLDVRLEQDWMAGLHASNVRQTREAL